MLNSIEKTKYNWEDQKKNYLTITKDLSKKDKYDLIDEILEKDVWAYFQLIIEACFELAVEEERYILLLERVYLKIRGDMAAGPFFNFLMDLGKNKREIGIWLYQKIQKMDLNKDFKIASGLIFGAYSIKGDSLLIDSLKERITFPKTNILLNAIFARYDSEGDLNEQVFSYLEEAEKSDNDSILKGLLNLYFALYPKNKDYFYSRVRHLFSKKPSCISPTSFFKAQNLGLAPEKFLELAELAKDCDEVILSELVSAITLNKDEKFYTFVERICGLFIYWINKDLEFKINNLGWALKELSKKNEKFIDFFIDNYSDIDNQKYEKSYVYIFPRIFEKIAPQNIEKSIRKIIDKKIYAEEPYLFYSLANKVIGIVYSLDNKSRAFEIFLPLAEEIESISEKKNFIDSNEKRFQNAIKNKNFSDLIDYVHGLLEQLQTRKEHYDFKSIRKSLKRFNNLNSLVEDKIGFFEKEKKYSPLLWLGERHEEDKLKLAYLTELNKGLAENKIERKRFRDSLGVESQFWERSSEIFFVNKFLEDRSLYNPQLEVLMPQKNSRIDLKIKLGSKSAYFEIKKLGANRNLVLDNGAVSIKNKARSILEKVHSQHFSESLLKQIEKEKDKTLLFAVLDVTSSAVDDYDILNALHGSLGVQWFINNKNQKSTKTSLIRHPDSLGDKNKKTNILSGVIYFKTSLEWEKGQLKLRLKGDLVENPNAINPPSKKEISELKKIIFEN